MSVVKYQSGGKTPTNEYEGLEDHLKKRLSELGITAKGATLVGNAASMFADAAKAGTLDKAFNSDEFKHTYAINSDALSADQASQNWNGSESLIKKNLFGQLNPKSQEEANSIVASLVGEFKQLKKSTPTSQKVLGTGITNTLGSLNDFVVNGEEELYRKGIAGKTNEEIKPTIMAKTVTLLDNYKAARDANNGKSEAERDTYVD
jgi:hypothetical protein